MPASYLMSWEPKSRRWWKQHQGKRYVVSCRQLGTPDTKDESYQAANEWWRQKIKDLAQHDVRTHPYAETIAELKKRSDRAKSTGDHDTAAEYQSQADYAQGLTEADTIEVDADSLLLTKKAKERRDAVQLFAGNLDDPMVADLLFSDRHQPKGPITPPAETISNLVRSYLDGYLLRRKANDLSDSEYALMQRCLGRFVEFIGGTNPPSAITAHRWEDYWKHLLKRTTEEANFGAIYAEKCFKYARRLVRWLGEMDVIVPPKNLVSTAYRFDTGAKEIELFTVDEVKKVIGAAPGRLKLHLLLMLNCGFTQMDCSRLLKSEVDLKKGTIRRKRSKTRRRHGENVPTVTYPLWPETLALLERYLSADPTLALTTETGRPLVDRGFNDSTSKATTRDSIASNYRHIKKRLKFEKPLKLLRKTAASELDHHGSYGRYAEFFLGEAPKSIAETHYVKPSQEQFDAAVKWLGERFGFDQ